MNKFEETARSESETATVVQVRESLVLIQFDEQAAVKKNEVGYVCVGDERLKAEVLRIRGRTADMQVFEDTSGVRVGDRVEMTDEMLSATLGPGLLGRVFDGLQNPARGSSTHSFPSPRVERDVFPVLSVREKPCCKAPSPAIRPSTSSWLWPVANGRVKSSRPSRRTRKPKIRGRAAR
jgi:vacuolar-type H+-ATPase subunit B/Vma2